MDPDPLPLLSLGHVNVSEMMAPPLTVGLALTDSKSSTYALQWALSRFKFTKDDDAPIFLLIHVLTKLLTVPTPSNYPIPPSLLLIMRPSILSFAYQSCYLKYLHAVGNHIPIDKVRTDVADAYFKDVHHQAQQMLLLYKNMCHQNKVLLTFFLSAVSPVLPS